MDTTKRNVNLYDAILDWVKNWEPDCAFSGDTQTELLRWQKKFHGHYRCCLGHWPKRVDLNETVTSHEVKKDHIREKILLIHLQT